ncbi:MoaD/ThiS family protein [Undibacterium umbellatum]|uniref:MoaD/ThiS family protein n=1 Tax=Undibacterium umbellatum TaxID=2762300 RepID=A0ABR6Z377_9BURK|nr:MoaD/ThiS family protein [Undibacterium umbellatum]MBC3906177.1 MoaD/ThiS family protein [Undibacterium umbellatum]
MARLIFTQQLSRFTEVPEVETTADNLRDALEAAFQVNPTLRGYILDEQNDLRFHVVVFIDGKRVMQRSGLRNSLGSNSQVYVLQALSGG